jgi:hypothetical protein
LLSTEGLPIQDYANRATTHNTRSNAGQKG